MAVQFTANAEADLEAIADYIALDNRPRAVSFIRDIRQRCARIERAPLAAPVARGIPGGLRKIPFGNYLIFYKQHRGGIVIVRILHGARDVQRHMRDADP